MLILPLTSKNCRNPAIWRFFPSLAGTDNSIAGRLCTSQASFGYGHVRCSCTGMRLASVCFRVLEGSMRHRAVLLCSFFLFITLLGEATTATKLTAEEAKNHIGEHATVCGLVASTHYAARSRSNPSFVNLDKSYPNHVVTIVIWGEDLAKCRRDQPTGVEIKSARPAWSSRIGVRPKLGAIARADRRSSFSLMP